MFTVYLIATLAVTDCTSARFVDWPKDCLGWLSNPGEYTLYFHVDRAAVLAGASAFVAHTENAKEGKLSCVRFENIKATQDKTDVPFEIAQSGTAGEPGWVWQLKVFPVSEGAFYLHVKTVYACPAS